MRLSSMIGSKLTGLNVNSRFKGQLSLKSVNEKKKMQILKEVMK
ncbi:hypothetical protein [Crassaminicella profunda]|nr:hypothetical protein [Crassaminicella profunda]